MVFSWLTASVGHLGSMYKTVPRPVSRFDTHHQARFRTFETKMAASNAKRSISTVGNWEKELEKLGIGNWEKFRERYDDLTEK